MLIATLMVTVPILVSSTAVTVSELSDATIGSHIRGTECCGGKIPGGDVDRTG